eukprot:2613369-Rhodomonas_salina.1
MVDVVHVAARSGLDGSLSARQYFKEQRERILMREKERGATEMEELGLFLGSRYQMLSPHARATRCPVVTKRLNRPGYAT